MNRLTSNSIILTFANIISLIIAFIIIVLLTRYLGVVDYGKYAFAKAFTGIFLYVADLGLNTLLIRDIAQNKNKASDYLGNVISLKIIISLFVIGIVYLIINKMNYPQTTIYIVYLATGIIIMTSFSNIFRSIFIAFERMSYEGSFMIISEIILLIGLISCIVLKINLINIMITFLFAWIFFSLMLIYIVQKRFVKFKISFNFTVCVFLFKNALPFALLGTLITLGTNIDSVMLSKFAGDSSVGIYNAASKLVAPLGFVSQAIAVTIFPFISNKWINNREEAVNAFRKSFKLLSIFGIPVAIIISILSNHIIHLFYGSQYSESATILKVIIWVAPFSYVTTLTGRVLSAINKQSILVYITMVYIIVNIVLNIILIPKYGGIGAAITLVLTSGLNYFIQQYYINKFFDNKFSLKIYIELILYSLPVGAIIFLLEKINWWLSLGSGIMLFVVIIFISKIYTIKDLNFILARVNKE